MVPLNELFNSQGTHNKKRESRKKEKCLTQLEEIRYWALIKEKAFSEFIAKHSNNKDSLFDIDDD